MKVFCITQARMNSSRLPGKILKTINSIPLIEYHLQRIKQSKLVDTFIVATTDTEADIPLVNYCREHKLNYFCGSEHNVLERFHLAASASGATPQDLIVRLTADCPLISSTLMDETIMHHQVNSRTTYTRLDLDYFPRGLDVEVFSMAQLTLAVENAVTEYEKEHVTPYMYQSQFSDSVETLKKGDRQWAKLRLCVDESNDFKLVEKLIKHFEGNWQSLSYQQLCQYLLDNPELIEINAQVKQHQG